MATSVASRWIGHSAERAALVTIYAATSLDALGGRYYGPDGPLEFKGSPDVAKTPAQAEDPAAAARLWDLTVRLIDDTRHEASPDDAADSGVASGRDLTSVAKGVMGVMTPWNFPFDLSLGPLIDILAAGNRAILKPV